MAEGFPGITTERPIEVLLVAPANAIGGQAQAARDILEGFAVDTRIRVRLQPSDPKLSGHWSWLTEVRLLRTLVRPLIYLPQLARAIEGADVVQVFCTAHLAFVLGALPAILLSRGRRKLILHYHDGRARSHLRWWGPFARWALRQGVLVVPSRYLQEVFGAAGLTAEVVPNVVDVEAFAYREPDPLPRRLLSTRWLEPLYAVENTLAAFRLLKRDFPDLVLDIYGGGVALNRLKRLAQEWDLGNARFHGPIAHAGMPAALARGGIMVNSSRIDNAPHFVIEAFAAGTPVVSTRAGGITFMVDDERSGLLVAVDEPDALARAVARLYREPELAVRLARTARGECSRYSWAAAANLWKALYIRLGPGLGPPPA